MVTFTVQNAGHALIAFTHARNHALEMYNNLTSCKTCSKQRAEQWKRESEMFSDLIDQLEKQV